MTEPLGQPFLAAVAGLTLPHRPSSPGMNSLGHSKAA